MSTILYVLLAILLLGILIAIHEFGHFLMARLTGIAVKEFAIGFGPKILSWKSKKYETVYSLRLLPLGGFNAFYGEDDLEGKEKDDPRAFGKQAVWKRMLVVLMGPGMNFILAYLVLFFWLWIGGIGVVTGVEPYISDVTAGSPAAQAGLRAGDIITEINGAEMLDGTTDTLLDAIASWQDGDAPLALTVRRGGETTAASVTPFWDAEEGRPRIGVIISARIQSVERQALTLPEAAREAGAEWVYVSGAILRALKNLVTTGEGLDQTAGPVGAISVISQEVRSGGLDAFLSMLATISVNLGLMNLLPIPGLDGSRFLFLLLEAIRRKPIEPKREAMVNLAGMALLFALMIFLTFRDVMNLFK